MLGGFVFWKWPFRIFIFHFSYSIFRHSRELLDSRGHLHGKTVELLLAADDIRFEFVLSHAKAVVNDDTRVRVFDGNKETQALIPSPDCVLSGSLKGNPDETAIISYCNGLVNNSNILFKENCKPRLLSELRVKDKCMCFNESK